MDMKEKSKFERRFRDEYEIVISFFDWMLKDNFRDILHCFAEDCGYSYNEFGVVLPSLYSKDEKNEEGYFDDGIVFFEHTSEMKIDFSMYTKCLELACEIYMEEHGEDEEVKRNLQIIKDRYAEK